MNPRTTAVLFLVAAALGAGVWFYEIGGETARKDSEQRAKQLFPEIEAEAVESITLTTRDGVRARFERRELGWQVVEPLVFPGDAFALDALASALAEISSEAVYDEPQGLEVYGLDAEGRELRFEVGGEEHGLRVGDKAPVGSSSYASIVGKAEVYTVATWRVNAIRKDFDDLRDKRILSFDAASIAKLTARWPDGRVSLERGEEGWRLTDPIEGAADQETVDGLLSNLAFLSATGFSDDPPSDAESGLDQPEFAVELEVAAEGAGEEPRRLQLAIGRLQREGWRLVRAGQPSLYQIADERLADFPRDLVAYRFKQLARFDPLVVERLELSFRPEQGESVTVIATRGEDGWQAGPEPMARERITALVDALSKLRAVDILADSAGPDELRTLELEPPNVALTVHSDAEDASEPLVRVRIGVFDGGRGIAAQVDGNPVIYLLEDNLAEHIPINLEAFHNRFLAEEEEAPPDLEESFEPEGLSPAEESP